jgi:hypothetical protein
VSHRAYALLEVEVKASGVEKTTEESANEFGGTFKLGGRGCDIDEAWSPRAIVWELWNIG